MTPTDEDIPVTERKAWTDPVLEILEVSRTATSLGIGGDGGLGTNDTLS